MSYHLHDTVTGYTPGGSDHAPGQAATEVALLEGDNGRIELAIGRPHQRLHHSWPDAEARVRLDRSAARRLAFFILARTE